MAAPVSSRSEKVMASIERGEPDMLKINSAMTEHEVVRSFKIPESVLVVIHTPEREVLLIERTGHPGFWQSVSHRAGIGAAGGAGRVASPRAVAPASVALTCGGNDAITPHLRVGSRNDRIAHLRSGAPVCCSASAAFAV